jgi:hypothetical protein
MVRGKFAMTFSTEASEKQKFMSRRRLCFSAMVVAEAKCKKTVWLCGFY